MFSMIRARSGSGEISLTIGVRPGPNVLPPNDDRLVEVAVRDLVIGAAEADGRRLRGRLHGPRHGAAVTDQVIAALDDLDDEAGAHERSESPFLALGLTMVGRLT
jgi:hypothetical protein